MTRLAKASKGAKSRTLPAAAPKLSWPDTQTERGWRRMVTSFYGGKNPATMAHWLDLILKEELPEFHAASATARSAFFDDLAELLGDPETHTRVLGPAHSCLFELLVIPKTDADFDVLQAIRRMHAADFETAEKALERLLSIRVVSRAPDLRSKLELQIEEIRETIRTAIYGPQTAEELGSAANDLEIDLQRKNPGQLAVHFEKHGLNDLPWPLEKLIISRNAHRVGQPGARPYGAFRDHAEVAARILEHALGEQGRTNARYLAAKFAARLLEAYVPEKSRGSVNVKTMLDKLAYQRKERAKPYRPRPLPKD